MSSSESEIGNSVTAIVDRTLISLRETSKMLDDLLAGAWAQIGMKHTLDSSADEFLAIMRATPHASSYVGQQLISLMEHKDPGVRALATFFTGLAGIPFSLTAPHLQ